MTVNYTTNLSLGQPVTGTESGTWGDDVNNAVTSYLDIAIAGGLSVTVTTADVTLTLTQGTSVATNIGSTTAQYAILNVSGAMTAARNLILPSSSRQYVINNACTGGFLLTVKGSATTGVTLVNGEKAHVFWNGSDYAKVSNTAGTGSFTDLTVSGSLTLSGGTANGVAYLNGSKVLTTGSALTFDGANLSGTGSIGTTIASKTAQFNAAGGSIYASFADGTKTWRFGAGILSAGTISLYNATDAVTAFTVDVTGNVGIGTSSPAHKLDVTSTSSSVASFARTTGTAVVKIQGISGNSVLAFGDGSTIGATSVWSLGRKNSDNSFRINYNEDSLDTTNYLIINSSGNVGIGTSSPGTKLDVNGAIRSTGTSAILAFSKRSTGTGDAWGMYSQSGEYNIYDYTAAASRLVIDTSGNVGIGTSSPVRKLDLRNTSADYQLHLGDTASTTLGYELGRENTAGLFKFYGNQTGATGYIFSGVDGERMRIDTSGNVGIGTSSPAAKLHVDSTSSGLMALLNSANANGGYAAFYSSGTAIGDIGTAKQVVNTGGSSDFAIGSRSGFLAFGTATIERMRIDSSGNLGLGVTPSAWASNYKMLQVGNNSSFGNASSGTYIGNNWFNDGANKYLTGTNFAALYSQVTGVHAWYNAPSGTAGNAITFTQAMTLTATGDLLVGTTSNAYSDKVVVNGNLGISGTQMNMAPGADFEFVQRSAFKMLFYVNAATVVANLSMTGVWTNASDARYKENIKDSPYGLATVMALKPRAYNLINLADKPQIGFIAQEVIDLVPEVVESVHNSVTNEDRYTLSYGNMVAVLTKAIQEQQALITSLTARITALEST